MLKHEAKLIDADADAIVAALSETTAAANKRCRARLLEDDPAKWRKFARAAAAEPDGYAMFRGGKGGVPATQVLAAWWTDSAGRKHVVIRGRRVEHDEAKRLLKLDELQTRTPLWHAYPDYVCRRFAGKSDQIVCACGCGAVGTPRALAWMGETCGPCFDRKEELGAAGLSANLPGVLYGHREPLGAVACSPDGNRVAAKEGDSSVSYWDIPARTRTTMKFSDHRVMDVAVTGDTRHLVVVGANTVVVGGLFAAFDLSTDPPTRLDADAETALPGWRMVALPDPDHVLVHRYNPAHEGASRMDVMRVSSGEVVRGTDLPTAFYGRFALAPDGKRFVTCGPVAVYDTDFARPPVTLADASNVVAFSHDGSRVFVHRSGELSRLVALDAHTGAVVASSERRENGGIGYLLTLAVDPGGEWVYAGGLDGRVLVFAADTLKFRAAFVWHMSALTGLAVSADGTRLFSSGGDGCVKVWPIRDLLRGV